MPNGQGDTPAPASPNRGEHASTKDENKYAVVVPLSQLRDLLVKPIPYTPPVPHAPKVWSINKLADRITFALGSTESVLIHTLTFIIAFAFVFLGHAFDTILLVVTTIVSLEAIYLSIFIQRTANKQVEKLERLVREIRQNTVIHLDQPLDQVVGEIHKNVQQLNRKMQSPTQS